jgi:thioesterase domain-containing protein
MAEADVRTWLVTKVADALGVPPSAVDPGAPLAEYAVESLTAIRLLAELSDRLGWRVAPTLLIEHPTLDAVARHLARQSAGAAGRPGGTQLVPLQPAGTRPPFFCVHDLAGTVFRYRDLAKHLGPDQPFYGLAALGLDGAEEPLDTIEALAGHYLTAVRAVQPQGPYFLGGWSMGGFVAFELAQQLRRQGQEVALVALLDSWAPFAGGAGAGGHGEQDVTEFAWGLAGQLSGDDLRRLIPDDERLARLLEEFREAGVTLPSAGLARVEDFLRVYRANRRALDAYLPRPYHGRVALCVARAGFTRSGSGRATPRDARENGWPEPEWLAGDRYERARAAAQDPTRGWAALVPAGFLEVHDMPGGHASMLDEPAVEVLAEHLRRSLRGESARRNGAADRRPAPQRAGR